MAIGDMGKMGKMIIQAKKAQKQMKQMEVAGQSGAINLIMNGLYEASEDTEIDVDVLANDLANLGLSREAIEGIAEYFGYHIPKSINDTKKQLEKNLANSANLDDLKGMFGI
jgi:DNA-binding protein YbaB